ncbi:MAG TPA: sugar phosphate isomerase/epimerase family protein [Phycisphaerae bacterium]|nr:sugar phosphate isomerase/epimerase [Phycisphaerae bacterium]HOI54951.1 sugar phosphate isomerase/epimerase family protein [Phycisphaerae bacterium]
MRIGICGLDRAAIARDAGYAFVEPAAAYNLKPDAGDGEWAALRERLLTCPLPTPACNLLLGGDLKLFGPERDMGRLEAYCGRLFERLEAIGCTIQVFGSGKARTPPAGYAADRALDELIEFTRRIAPMAAAHGVVLAMEHLRRAECGLLTTVAETTRFVREVNHPAVRLLIDTYHLAQEGEPLEVIDEAAGLIVHVHVADGVTRHEPSRAGSDLRPVFRRLKAVGYDAGISVECAWQDIDRELKPTRDLVAAQWAEA